MNEQTIEKAALGRPFSLGTLYDCRNESIATGLSLWDYDDLSNHIGERPQYYSDFEIVASESTDHKSSALSAEVSAALYVLVGLIKTKGSAKYLCDNIKSKNQARVTLKYEVTTKFRELSMDHLGADNVKHREIFKQNLATHVVTGILYGARAFFVFDSDVAERENYEEIVGKLKFMIKMIPLVKVKCNGSVKMNNKDLANYKKFSCKFIGDFSLETNPVTYQDAVQVYHSLPKLLGPDKENAIPLKVWLLPLTYFDPSATKLQWQISTALVHKVQCVLENITDLQIRCNDAINTTTAQQFQEISKNLKAFRDLCITFKEKLQKAFISYFLQKEEKALKEIFTHFNKLMEWMDWEEKEIYFVKYFTNMMENTKIVPSQKELDVELLSADHTVCFVWTSVFSNYLEKMQKAEDLQHQHAHSTEPREQLFSAVDTMRHKTKLFTDFADANKENNNIKFLIVGLASETKGGSIHLYKESVLVTKDFQPPSKPETVTGGDVSHNSVTLNICPPQYGAKNITCYRVEFCVRGEKKWQRKRASAAGEFILSSLTPNTEYMIRCRAETPAGVGPLRELSGSVKTLPLKTSAEMLITPPKKVEYVKETITVQDVKPCCQCGKKITTVDVSTTTCESSKSSQRVQEDFAKLEWRCNNAMKTTIAQQFSEIGKNLQTFKDLCFHLKVEFQQSLTKTHSSATTDSLNKWMDCQEKEIDTLISFIHKMKNTEIVPSVNDLYKEIYSREKVVCFLFTSVGSDSYLSTLSNYLNKTTEPDLQPPIYNVEDGQWFFSEEILDVVQHKLKLFSDFTEANKDGNNMKYLTGSLTNKTAVTKGVSIHLYKDGVLVTEDFEPPSNPETVTGSDVTHNSVKLNICPPQFGAANIICYCIEYCVRGENKWQPKRASTAGEFTVSSLTPNTEYMIRCRAVTSAGVGPLREFRGSVKTLPTSPPQKLHVKPTAREIAVTWEKPAQVFKGVHKLSYIVEYMETDSELREGHLQWKQIVSTSETGTITGLQPETNYTVRVRCECGEAGSSRESIPVIVYTTKSLTELLKSTSLCLKSDLPSVYQLPLTEDANPAGCRSYSLGKESEKQSRTIILVGPAGSGKSTLINTMINYIVGVEWSDDVRFKLVKEAQWESQNQTSEVTVYKIHHQEGFTVPYSLTVVDTPGFGCTGGIEQDKEIRRQILRLLTSDNGVSEIDAVCVVVPAALNLNSPSQKRVFDSMLSIFGKDVAKNIRVLVTFADGKHLPLVDVVRALGVLGPQTQNKAQIHFKFNNSALFEGLTADDSEEWESLNEIFWSMGTKSMKRFFVDLNNLNTQSLILTKEVLREREDLEDSVENLQKLIKLSLIKQDEIKHMIEILENCEAEITTIQGSEFEFTVKKRDICDISLTEHHTTNCLQCQYTCHYPCFISGNEDKNYCSAIGKDGHCTECPGKCKWMEHVSQPHKWEYEEFREKHTVQELKKKYINAAEAQMSTQAVVDKVLTEYESVEDDMMKMMERSASCLQRLEEIGLKPNQLSITEYIDTLIESEKSEAKPGWRGRLHSLMVKRQKAELIDKICRGEEPCQLCLAQAPM
ncbi:Stonustoxin subunit beta [Channa argus]|uniref:Stonustoxin subunit beta n=2 Tax=Channa argus TaxID=215402 RepID=A0A6G1P788_CHAAH|nr:Stonustoxin subunit beta [Channa argus]KAK2920501.1 hypothetical protein Q8A73_002705 [Channa argus]